MGSPGPVPSVEATHETFLRRFDVHSDLVSEGAWRRLARTPNLLPSLLLQVPAPPLCAGAQGRVCVSCFLSIGLNVLSDHVIVCV